jgi:hypothetical protein
LKASPLKPTAPAPMPVRRGHLNPAEILQYAGRRPLYYLLLKSQPIRNGNYRPSVVAEGYATITAVARGRRRGKGGSCESPVASVCIPGLGDFNNYKDGTGEREGMHLYIYLHRRDAQHAQIMAENRNRAAANAILSSIGENLGEVRFH